MAYQCGFAGHLHFLHWGRHNKRFYFNGHFDRYGCIFIFPVVFNLLVNLLVNCQVVLCNLQIVVLLTAFHLRREGRI